MHESPIQRILVESALIVFSILLALGVNSYVDTRKEHRLTERALRGVHDEIATNLRAIRDVRSYHDTLGRQTHLADSLHQATSYAAFASHVPAWSGLHNPELDNTAWESALTLGTVANMGYDTVRVLSSLYAKQAKFDAYASSGFSSFDFADAAMPSTVRRIYVYAATVRVNEDALLAQYAAALRVLGDTVTR